MGDSQEVLPLSEELPGRTVTLLPSGKVPVCSCPYVVLISFTLLGLLIGRLFAYIAGLPESIGVSTDGAVGQLKIENNRDGLIVQCTELLALLPAELTAQVCQFFLMCQSFVSRPV